MADYPLEAALTVRESARERAEAALAQALRDERDARAKTKRAAERLEAHRAEDAARVRQPHDTVKSALELQREALHRARRREEEARLSDALARARRDESSARAAVEQAQRAVAQAAAEVEVVERHHDRWKRGEQERAERAADEELEDTASSRRS
jgi:hypothetical protein